MNFVKKLNCLLLSNITVFFCIFFFYDTVNAQSSPPWKTVVIDAGHGGKDPGAISGKVNEKDVVLAIALKLGNYIEKNLRNIKVIYTRKTDKFIELHERSAIANRNKADLFISIHADAVDAKKIQGTSTYVMGLHKVQENLEVAKRENSVILEEKNYKKNYSGFDPNSPEYEIIFSLYQDVYLHQSILFADKVQKQFKKRAGRKDRGVKQAGLVVLWNCTMPGVLIETGFVTNPNERKFLKSDYGQSIIASAIFRAVRSYFGEIYRASGTSANAKTKKQTKTANSGTEALDSEKVTNSEKHEENIKNTSSDIIFKIQIASSPVKKSTNPSNFKGLKNVEREFLNGRYKYYAGSSKDFNEIVEIQTKIREKFPDAFVIATKNNKRIPMKEALEQNKN